MPLADFFYGVFGFWIEPYIKAGSKCKSKVKPSFGGYVGLFIGSIVYIMTGLCGFFITFTLVMAFMIPTWIFTMPFTALIYLCKGITVIRRKLMFARADHALEVPNNAY